MEHAQSDEPYVPIVPVVRNALALSHDYIRKVVRPGDLVVDATAGNGHDTLFLAGLVGPEGLVLAFDVQQEAVRRTVERLEAAGMGARCRVFAEGHQHLGKRVHEVGLTCRASAVMFNLGYLPGADHSSGTRATTTLPALGQAMACLRTGGIVTVGIYYGGDSGFEEKEAVLAFVESIDVHEFVVQKIEMVNSKSCPPIFLCIEKLVPGKRRDRYTDMPVSGTSTDSGERASTNG